MSIVSIGRVTMLNRPIKTVFVVECENVENDYAVAAHLLWFLMNGFTFPEGYPLDKIHIYSNQNLRLPLDKLIETALKSPGQPFSMEKPQRAWLVLLHVTMKPESDTSQFANFLLLAKAHEIDMNTHDGGLALVIDEPTIDDDRHDIEELFGDWNTENDPAELLRGSLFYSSHGRVSPIPSHVRGRKNIFFPAMLITEDSRQGFATLLHDDSSLHNPAVSELRSRVKDLLDRVIDEYAKGETRSGGETPGLTAYVGDILASWETNMASTSNPLGQSNYLTLLFFGHAVTGCGHRLREWQRNDHNPGTLAGQDRTRSQVSRWLVGTLEYCAQAAQAILNLIDNVTKHVGTQMIADGNQQSRWCAAVLFRVLYNGKSREGRILRSILGDAVANDTRYAVVSIIDYSPYSLNLADTFIRESIEPATDLNEEDHENFRSRLTPVSFLQDDSSMRDLWKKYRSDSKLRYWKHYGLNIFTSMLADCHYKVAGQRDATAIMRMSSHTSPLTQRENTDHYLHTREKDTFSQISEIGDREGFVLPGTRFTTAIPLFGFKPSPQRTQTAESSPVTDDARYLDWKTADITDDLAESIETEESAIRTLADLVKKNTAEVLMVDARRLHNKHRSEADVMAKAVIGDRPWKTQASRTHAVVFYHCSSAFINGFDEVMNAYLAAAIDQQWQDFPSNFDGVLLQDLDEIDGQYFLRIYRPDKPIEGRLRTLQWLHSVGQGPDHSMGNASGDGSPVPPYEVLCPYRDSDEAPSLTLFERHIQKILLSPISEELLGCLHDNIHVRLGSTVHLNQFYQGEFLFSIPAFQRQYAFLIAQQIINRTWERDDLILYGYALYSEGLLINLKELLRTWHWRHSRTSPQLYPVVYERRSEDAEGEEKDRLRWTDPEPPKNSNAKAVILVPLGSTLKTVLKMKKKLEEEKFRNGRSFATNDLLCTTLIAIGIGSNDLNPYWSCDERQRSLSRREPVDATFNVRYLVPVPAQFSYPLALKGDARVPDQKCCPFCFPVHPIDEVPLTETNPDSTIPLLTSDLSGRVDPLSDEGVDDIVQREFDKLKHLTGYVKYPHFIREDHEYEYYIETEKILQGENNPQDLKKALKEWQKTQKNVTSGQKYHDYLVCPLNRRNATFLYMVNQEVFQGKAEIISVDVDRDDRSTFKAKYSWILSSLTTTPETTPRFHFVNDTMTTGRSLERARTLVQSIVPDNLFKEIFHWHFFLVDRRSEDSWRSLTQSNKGIDQIRFAFIDLHIPYLRHHGNSCHWCRKERTARRLARQSVNPVLVQIFTAHEKKHGKHSLQASSANDLYSSYSSVFSTQPISPIGAWTRMFCADVGRVVLPDCFAESTQSGLYEETTRRMIALLTHGRPGGTSIDIDEAGYFNAYLEALSRPYLSDRQSVRRSIFRIIVAITDYLARGTAFPEDLSEIESTIKGFEKAHLQHLHEESGCPGRGTNENRCSFWHLLNLLMSRLDDLHSTYLIRPDLIVALRSYILQMRFPSDDQMKSTDGLSSEEVLLVQQLAHIKSVTHGTTDTSWSAWLDRELHACLTWDDGRLIVKPTALTAIRAQCQARVDRVATLTNLHGDLDFLEKACSPDFLANLIMENNRVFYEAVDSLARRTSLWPELSADPITSMETAIPAIVQALASDSEDFEDYIFGNIRACLPHIVNPENAWVQDQLLGGDIPDEVKTYEDLQECADKELKSALIRMSWLAAILTYLRAVLRKSDESQTGQLLEHTGSDHFQILAQMLRRALDAENVVLAMEYVPPFEKWKDSSFPAKYKHIDYVSLGEEDSVAGPESGRRVSDPTWDVLTKWSECAPEAGSQKSLLPSTGFPWRVKKKDGGETLAAVWPIPSEDQPAKESRYYDDQQQNCGRGPYLIVCFAESDLTWNVFDRIRLTYMLRHTIMDRLFSDMEADQLMLNTADKYTASMLRQDKTASHDWGAKQIELYKFCETLDVQSDDDKKLKTDIPDPRPTLALRASLVGLSVAHVFRNALVDSWVDYEYSESFTVGDLVASLPEKIYDFENKKWIRICTAGCVEARNLCLATYKPMKLEKETDKLREHTDLLLAAIGNAGSYAAKTADNIIDVTLSTPPGNCMLLEYPHRKDKDMKDAIEEANDACLGVLPHAGRLHMTFWALGRLTEIAWRSQDQPTLSFAYMPPTVTLTQPENRFQLRLPWLVNPR